MSLKPEALKTVTRKIVEGELTAGEIIEILVEAMADTQIQSALENM